MAKEPTKTSSDPGVTVEPVFALCKIVYGDNQHATANSIFAPVSEDERNELFRLEAVRELTDTEKFVAARMGLTTIDVTPVGATTNDAPAPDAAPTNDEIK